MSELTSRPPLPPFTLETAKANVQAAENAWSTRDPEGVALAYTEDSEWRDRNDVPIQESDRTFRWERT